MKGTLPALIGQSRADTRRIQSVVRHWALLQSILGVRGRKCSDSVTEHTSQHSIPRLNSLPPSVQLIWLQCLMKHLCNAWSPLHVFIHAMKINDQRPNLHENFGEPMHCTCRSTHSRPNLQPDSYETRSDSITHQYTQKEGIGDEPELEAALQEVIVSMIDLLEHRYAELVWRAEILDQTPREIAREMKLSEEDVSERLKTGRGALLNLVLLTLQPPFA